MNTIALAFALLMGSVGCAGFYLASPHQRWLASRLPVPIARAVAGFLLLASLVVASYSMQALPAVFVMTTWIMVQLIIFPYWAAIGGRSPRSR